MKKFNHTNLVKLYEIIDDPLDNKYYMILEYMERGSILSSSYMMYELKSQDPKEYENTISNYKLRRNQKRLSQLVSPTISELRALKYFQ